MATFLGTNHSCLVPACNIEPAHPLAILRLNLFMLHDMDANTCILRLQEPPLVARNIQRLGPRL